MNKETAGKIKLSDIISQVTNISLNVNYANETRTLLNNLIILLNTPSLSKTLDLILNPDTWLTTEQYEIVKNLVFLLINHQPVISNGCAGSITQIAIPVVIQKYSLKSLIDIKSELPVMILNEIGNDIVEILGLPESSKIILNPYLFSHGFLSKNLHELYELPSYGLSGQSILDSETFIFDENKELQLFYIYGIITEPNETHFAKTNIDSKLSDPRALWSWREKHGKVLQKFMDCKHSEVNISIGAPSVLTHALTTGFMYSREYKIWSLLGERLLTKTPSEFTSVFNEDPQTGRILIRIYCNNYCIFVFDYGYAMAKTSNGKIKWLDTLILEHKLKKHGFSNIIHEQKNLQTTDLEGYLNKPLIY